MLDKVRRAARTVLHAVFYILFCAFVLLIDEIFDRMERPHDRYEGTLAQKWGWVE
jgi:hypothetical protein